MKSVSGTGARRRHEHVRTACGRELTVGRLALGDERHPASRVFVDLGSCSGCDGASWAGLTVAEARALARALLAQAAAAERARGPAGAHAPARPARELPAWSSVLAVVAHPDDESFGLGAVLDALAAGGAAVHVLCYTHGEASTLNETGADLRRARESELRQAGAELGVASVTLLDYPDGRLAETGQAELAGHVAEAAARLGVRGLLVFDDTGVTGHPDHRAATAAAVRAARPAGLPVLAWTLPDAVAARLRAETGQPFAGRPDAEVDRCVRVGRGRQRRAAMLHASQVSPSAVLWRRLQLQGDCEHLRWLVPPPAL